MPANKTKIKILSEDYGFDNIDEMLEASILDSIVPAICINEGCDYTTDMEPDQDRGWCEECEKPTVQSCLILAGVI